MPGGVSKKTLVQRESRSLPLLATCPGAETEGGGPPEVLEEELPLQRLLEAKEEREQGEVATFSVVAGPVPHLSELSGIRLCWSGGAFTPLDI